jgi:O-antigen/teichoic acid export membrane protein
MDSTVTQGAARGNDGTVTVGLATKMKWGLLGSVAAVAVAIYYFYGKDYSVAWSMLFAAAFIPLMEPFGVFNAVLFGKKDFRLSSLFGIAGQLFSGLALAASLFLTNNTIIIFIVYAASWTISRYISLRITLKTYPTNEKVEPHAVSYALHASLIGAFNTIISSIDTILVYHFLGPAQLAAYAFATAPVSQTRTILNTPTILAIPKLADQTAAQIRRTMKQKTPHLLLIGALAMLGYCALAVPFYKVFLPRYTDAVPFSLFFSVTILLQVITAYVHAALDARATLIPKRLLYLWNIPSITIAACAILLIQRYGLWGAMMGQVLSYAASCGVSWFLWFTIRHKEHPSNPMRYNQ